MAAFVPAIMLPRFGKEIISWLKQNQVLGENKIKKLFQLNHMLRKMGQKLVDIEDPLQIKFIVVEGGNQK